MSNETASGSAPVTCWNCGQQLPVGSEQCVYCGVMLQEQSVPLVVAPHGAVVAGAAPVPTRAPEAGTPLGAEFSGHPAAVGARLIAFTVDALVILLVAAIAGVVGRSAVLGGVVLIEALAIVGIVQARTGASLGNLVARVRVSRADAPYSPGVGRSLVRGIIVGAGGLVALVGAWVVVLSSAWDGDGLRRSWADRAAKTVVVQVPPRALVRARRVPVAAPIPAALPAEPYGFGAPQALMPTEPPASPAARQPLTGPAQAQQPQPQAEQQGRQARHGRRAARDDEQRIQPATGAPLTLPDPQPIAPTAGESIDVYSQSRTGVPPLANGSVPIDQRGPAAPTQVSGEGLLLVFDTGQRELLPIPAAANLGRNPAPTEATDRLIIVRDPESTVSKTHTRLEHTRSGTWITDQGSTNGTDLIDEEGHATPVQPHTRTHVEDGVRVRLGNRVFTISVLLGDGS